MHTYLKHLASLAVVALLLAAPVSAQSDYHWKLRHSSDLPSPQLRDVAFFNDTHGLVAANGGVYRSEDGGLTWNYIRLAEETTSSRTLTSISIVDESTAWVCGWHGLLFVTRDAGETFEDRSLAAEYDMSSMHFIDNMTGLMAGDSSSRHYSIGKGAILRTRDGGENWEVVQVSPYDEPSWVSWSRMTFVDDSNGWVVGTRGGIARTTDGGENWHEFAAGLPHRLYALHAFSPDHVVVAGESAYIIQTTDGGSRWLDAPRVPGSRVIYDIVIRGDGVGWMATNSATVGILRTGDNGSSWTPETLLVGEMRTVRSLGFTPDGRLLAVCDEGDIFERIGEGVTSVENDVLPGTLSINAYPSPMQAASQVSLQLAMLRTEHALVTLYGMDGRKIATLHDALLTEGMHTLRPSTPILAPGVYFIALRTASGQRMCRLLVGP
jgi:photosystem II stability/assembly factor-like uncharacterized protein